jgi:hypothetical protein
MIFQYRRDIPDDLMKKLPQSIEANRSKEPAAYIKNIAYYIARNSSSVFNRNYL